MERDCLHEIYIYEKCRVKREGLIGHDKVEEISLFVTMPAAPDDGKSLRRREGKELYMASTDLWYTQVFGNVLCIVLSSS